MRALFAALLLPLAAWAAGGDGYVSVPGGTLTTVLRYEDVNGPIAIAPIEMMKRPVTNAEFLLFVKANPQWRRDRIAPIFADTGYLAHWPGPVQVAGREQADEPVTRISWFAADAYCAAQGARLPRWLEWEYVAAADATRRDARRDPAWRERTLRMNARPVSSAVPAAARQAPNVYGVRDLHGVVWEWVDDHSALLVSADNRDQGDPERYRFCGAGALSTDDREDYAVLMRIAMLSSLGSRDTSMSTGFRCIREIR